MLTEREQNLPTRTDFRSAPPQWNVEETRLLVERLYGRGQLKLAASSLRSTLDRQAYARIHYQDAERVFKTYVKRSLSNSSLIEVALGCDSRATHTFQVFITKMGAYLMGCVQSLHSLPDIFGHALYYSLGLNLHKNPIPERAISAWAVHAKLKELGELSSLSTLFHHLYTTDDFNHLAGLANLGKHKNIVLPSLGEDQTGVPAERHSVKFSSFSYKGHQYHEVDAKSLLSAEYNRTSLVVIQVGNELNSILRARLAEQPIE